MWKPLVVLAIVANTVLITTSEGTRHGTYPEKRKSNHAHRKCKQPNEIFDHCPNPCPPRECGINKALILCAPAPKPGSKDCKPGCRCADGFLKNRAGICIPEKKCQYDCAKNETLDPCYSDCPPRRCGVNIAAVSCLAIDDSDCVRGCRCSDGYSRNAEGNCVLEEDCSQCPEPYEMYDICPNPCPPQRCGVDPQVIRCAAPPEPGDPECEPGCRCIDGYVRNEDGRCVTRDQCPPTCGEDEIYSTCTNSDCEPQNCSQLGFPIPCPRIDPAYCVKGCVCRQGLVRAANGTCIPKEKCPSCGGDPKAISGCGNNCGRRCSNYNSTKPVFCTEICNLNGCDCKKGYVLDDSTGKCIRPKQCVSCRGDFNAEPGCDKNCTQRCPGPKPSECKCYEDGCACKQGFVFDPKIYKCVRLEQCTPSCGENEALSNCSNGGCGPWRCTDVGFPTGCVKMDQKYCIVDCVCKDGYVRDDNEVCIPATDCPECGGDPNAIVGCGINCGRLCSNYKHAENVSCVTVCYDNACDCRKGFVLDENINKCVTPKQCTPVCGKNEVFSECVNGGCQAKNCSQIGEPVPCVKPAKCKPGCLCAEGFLRDDSGVCIPKDQCPPKCTGANEIYDPCPPSCPPQTCESFGQKYFCPLMPANKTSKDCHGACRCKPNFFRNKIGECISAKNCQRCTGDYEYFSCGGACDNVCAKLSKQNKTNCPIINIQCNEMCYCEDGYARNKHNICIPIEHCPSKCSENERWEECPATLCSPQSCKDLGFNITCDFDENEPCPGPPGCVCDYNFVRNEDGKCIPKKECPPVCKEHEVYSECTNGGCQARNCTQLGQPVPCVKLDPKSCIKGCVCEDGYLRARNGTCVPENKCDNCNKPHEHYNSCAPSCPPQTCESIEREYDCPATAAVCRGACRCDKGYFRNKKEECIRKKDCLKCTGPYEYWSCGSACDNVCATLYKQNQTNCPIKNIKCTEMCYCEEGYARDKYNVCIPIDKCPKPRCGVNERLEECPPGLCTPQKCSQLGFPVACPDFPESGCPEPPGCVCIDNYVRDNKGRCIPSQNCPSCGGDPKAISGCGVNCGRTCSTYNRTDIACVAVCYFNACDCRKGYVFDDNLKKCVRPEHCTPTCGNNEVYNSCANGGCGKWNCSQLGQPDLCIDVIECIGGCICQEGYLRAENGTCVPINQCPIPPCGKNERFEFCPDSVCEPQTCTELGFPLTCPALSGDTSCPGEPTCICDNGFVRDEFGDCIPKKQCPSCGGDKNAESGCGINCGRLCSNYNKGPVPCPKICKLNACDCKKDYVFDSNTNKCVRPKKCTPICGKDEVFSECINGGCQPKNCSQLGKPVPCVKIDSKNCIKGCLCKEGYLREANGVCVPEKKCGLKCTGLNEYWSCGSACDNVCKNLHEQNQTNCPIKNIKCTEMCYCKKGYARDDNKICVPIEKCPPPKCGENERLEECPDWLCTPQSCSQLGYPIACPALLGDVSNNATCPGRPGCVCIDNYVRHDCGECIPVDECESCGGDRYAVSGCGANCGRLCSNYKQKNVICPLVCKINGCDCRKGFVFDTNTDKCVLPKHCTPTCGNNEVYDICANGGCQKRNCSQSGGPTLCIDPIKCIGGCVCQEGFLRNKNGTCVPENQCPLKCSRPNEHFSCGPPCDNVCATLATQNQTNCPIVNKRCNPQCYCDEGYARDDNDICIPFDQCGVSCRGDPNAKPGCGRHCGNRCSDYNKGVVACPLICMLDGCDCKQSYVFDDNLEKCVQPEACITEKCYGEHKVFDPCPKSPRTCESVNNEDSCDSESSEEESPCEPGCVCEEGYYENTIGQCLTKEECLKCTRPHEYYSCGGACDNVCNTLNEQNQTNCLIINIKCNEMCYCEDGYARNASNICIPIKDCPPSRCGPDESYEETPCRVCEPLTCSEVGMDLECPPVEDDDCDYTPGCICKSGLVRNDDGVCIPISECPSETTVNVTEARARLDQGSIALSGKFLHFLVSSNPDKNCVASPTSLLIPLAQLALFATGLVLEEILKLLNLRNKQEIMACFPELIAEFSNQSHVDFKEATKYYANIKYPLSEPFKRDSKQYFGAEGENVDFSKADKAAALINEWVYNQTRGKIQDLVNADMFSADTRLCLVNAIYFLGNWVKQFNPNDTEVKDFHKSNGEIVPLKIMYQQNTFNYAETDQYQVLEMLYKGNNFSFVVVLPRNKEDLLPTLKTIQEPGAWNQIMNSLSPQKCQVYLPKMLLNTEIDIKKLLMKYGVDKMFDQNNNGFQGMLEKEEPVYVSDAVQKAFMSVDETGTEAAAATAITVTTLSLQYPPPKNYLFKATHPFIFQIKFAKTPLFCMLFVGAQ